MKNFAFFKIIVLISIIGTSSLNLFSQGVVISDNTSDTPDPSAMLEIKSNSKGLLIPRMTTAERNSISSPVDGLLIFDSTEGNFYLYGQGRWNDLSTPAGIWSVQSSNVYLTNSANNIGIGTETPSGKFVIKADAAKADSDPLFEIQDKYGETIFSVTSEGARLYVKDMGKGVSGGFAVAQYGTVKSKAAGDEFFIVTPDSTRVYSLPGAKGVAGGFAVGQYGTVKGGVRNTTFYSTSDSTRIYTNTLSKGVAGGFAVGQYGTVKGAVSNYMHITPDNYFIGHEAGLKTVPGVDPNGRYNLFFGYRSGYENTTGFYNTFIGHNSGYGGAGSNGTKNTFLGYQSGFNILGGSDNVLLGYQAGYNVTTAGNNISVGSSAGFRNTNNSDNIFIGRSAGYNHIGTGVANSSINNIFIGLEAGFSDATGGTGSNNIYIGTESGKANIGGWQNVFIGYQSGVANTNGSRNVFIGDNAGLSNTDGRLNTFVGTEAGKSSVSADYSTYIGHRAGWSGTEGFNTAVGYNSGASGITGSNRAFLGYSAGSTSTGDDNTYLGAEAGYYSYAGANNIYIGTGAGRGGTGSDNVFIGKYSGYSATGSRNVFLGNGAGWTITGSDTLAITNTPSSVIKPLILGSFDENNKFVEIDGSLTFNKGTNSVKLPTTRGTSGYVLSTDGVGGSSWTNVIGGLITAGNGLSFSGSTVGLGGSLTSATTISLANNYLLYNMNGTGDFYIGDGVSYFTVRDDGNVGIGTTAPSQKLHVVGNTYSTGNIESGGVVQVGTEVNRASTGTANLVPIAYGILNADGTIASGSGNFTSSWDAVNYRYIITITGESYYYLTYTTNVTCASSSTFKTGTTTSSGGDLWVTIWNHDGTKDTNGNVFSFTVYKQ